jgi:hypothetical protein
MYTSFEVRHFRCFQDLTITGLDRVNLIAGANNVGKTALLEALFLHCGAYNPELAMRINAFRGIETMKVTFGKWVETPWDSLFYQFDTQAIIELKSENTATGFRSLRLKVVRQPWELATSGKFTKHPEEYQGLLSSSEFAQVLRLEYKEGERHGAFNVILDPKGPPRTEPIPPAPPFPAFFQVSRMRYPFAVEAELFGKLEIHGKQDVLLRVLQLIEPRLKRLAIVMAMGEPILHGDVGTGRLMPLPVMGEGMEELYARESIEITRPTVLLVEGKDDKLFFEAFINNQGLQNIQTLDIGGKTRLRQNLKVLKKTPKFSELVISLGVVRDANTDPTAAFQSVRDALQSVNLPAPERPLVPVGDAPPGSPS